MRLLSRRCSHPDHNDPSWQRQHLQKEARPTFIVDLDEEDKACLLGLPKYMDKICAEGRRWLGYCPHHRVSFLKKPYGHISEWITAQIKDFERSSGRKGLDPERVRAVGLNPNKYCKTKM